MLAATTLAALMASTASTVDTNQAWGIADFADPLDPQFLVTTAPAFNGTFKLSATLQHHMVLQRAPASAVVWGFATAGTTVTTTFAGGKTITSMAGSDTVWRAKLPPTPASATPTTLSFKASTGETATLDDVLFGDVYVCGGQSNMQFSVGGNQGATTYAAEANKYPDIRLFTVGQKTSSKVPLTDLQTIEQNWTAASNKTVMCHRTDGSLCVPFDYFSAVCWFFGKNVYDKLGGSWTTPESTAHCGHNSTGELYNAMIVPYAVGPMAVSGFTWYQGESDLGGSSAGVAPWGSANNNYSCTQTAMIEQWRTMFQVPSAFYAIVQLSTWFTDPLLLAELRDQQLVSMKTLKNFAYGTNADYGAGGNIHPPYKQHVGERLANAAMAIVYNKPINWRSPTYLSAKAGTGTTLGEVTVSLNDVLAAGLTLKPSFNAHTAGSCHGQKAGTCAGASVQFDDTKKSWVKATVGLSADKQGMMLTAPAPAGAKAAIATSYGWGAVPMMTVYRADMEGEDGQLPVLTWNRTL